MATKDTGLYFTTVCAFPHDAAVLGGHLVIQEDDPQGTRLMVINKEAWTHLGDMMDVVYAIALSRPPGGQAFLGALGREGLYREFPFGAGPRDVPLAKTDPGYLEDLRVIDQSLYACGAQGQVYRQQEGRWQAIHDGIHIPFNGRKVERMLLSIAGFSERDIYACGFGGEVWRFDGTRWAALDSPTNLPLNAAFCAPDKRVYFCGEAGNLFALAADGSWANLSDKNVSAHSFYDLTWFRDRLYVAADDKLLYLDADRLSAVKDPGEGNWRFSKIDAAADRIWCVGGEEVFDYDGETWTRHICSENE